MLNELPAFQFRSDEFFGPFSLERVDDGQLEAILLPSSETIWRSSHQLLLKPVVFLRTFSMDELQVLHDLSEAQEPSGGLGIPVLGDVTSSWIQMLCWK